MISVIGGTTLMSIGVLGEYVGKMYEQIKNRPLYVVSRLINIQPAKRNEPESRVEALKKQ
jgi:dolichol-phosphate mannosyltransferase